MRRYIAFSIVLIGAIFVNLFYLKITLLGAALALIYFLYYGSKIGHLLLSKLNNNWARFFGPVFLASLVSLIGGLTYYLYNLNNQAILFLLISLPLILILAQFKLDTDETKDLDLSKAEIVLPTASPVNRLAWLTFFADLALFYHLFERATTDAIRSPWLILSPKFFLFFALSSASLVLFLRSTKRTLGALFTIFIHSLLMLSIALIVYKLGYGFDPFIHRAAESYVANLGEITPKTPYYIGQYALVVFLHKISLLPLDWIDKLLVPLIEALWLPPLIFLLLRQGLNLKLPLAQLGAIFFLIIPFPDLIATTPQTLANFYALQFILWGAWAITGNSISLAVPLLFAAAALITHPLIGIPIMIAAILMILIHYSPPSPWLKVLQATAITLVIILAILALPAVSLFYAASKNTALSIPSLQNILAHWPPISPLPKPRPGFPFHIGWAMLYYYDYFLPYLYLIISGLGGYLLFKNFRKLVIGSVVVFIIFWFNILLLKTAVVFPQVINYEQNQYPDRLAQFSFYLFLPLFLVGLYHTYNFFAERHRLTAAALMGALITISLYLSYPRVDPFAFSRTFNVSAADVEAVEKIAELAGSADYVVLSNQILAAAAVEKFGFKKYYPTPKGLLFYYSLPTGGELYDYYQKMVYESPSRETALAVMRLTGASEVYLAINDYWNSFKQTAPLAKKTANQWWGVAGGRVLIFRYRR